MFTRYYRQFSTKKKKNDTFLHFLYAHVRVFWDSLKKQQSSLYECFFRGWKADTTWAWKLSSDVGIAKAILPPIPRRGRTCDIVHTYSKRRK